MSRRRPKVPSLSLPIILIIGIDFSATLSLAMARALFASRPARPADFRPPSPGAAAFSAPFSAPAVGRSTPGSRSAGPVPGRCGIPGAASAVIGPTSSNGMPAAAGRADRHTCCMSHHRRPGVHEPEWLVTLCASCHARIHRLQAIRSYLPPVLLPFWEEQHPDVPRQLQFDLGALAA